MPDLFRNFAGAFRLIQPELQDIDDVTGAGDTVVGVLSLALAAGATVPEATQLANLAAGVVVAIGATALVAGSSVAAWGVLPLAVAGLLAFSVWRAASSR